MRSFKKLPSPAMAVAFAALFAALAGGAVAAAPLVTGGDIKNNSVTTKDVKDRSLLRKDFKRGQIPAGARGSQGPQGIAGPAGRAGRDGTNGFGQLVYSQGEGDPVANGQLGDEVVAICPDGTFPTGGDAFYIDESDVFVPDQQVGPQGIVTDQSGTPVGWAATPIVNGTGAPVTLVVDAICANASDIGFAITSKGKAQAKVEGLERPARFQVQRP